MKRKHNEPSDSELFKLFRDFCASDEECDKTVADARRAFTMIRNDRLYRKEGL